MVRVVGRDDPWAALGNYAPDLYDQTILSAMESGSTWESFAFATLARTTVSLQ